MPGRDTRPHSRNLRVGRRSIPGCAYLVTTATHRRLPLLQKFQQACLVCRAIDHVSRMSDTQTLCYVVMPDHLHWLIQLGEQHGLSTTVSMMKNLSSRWLGGQIWQAGFHDRALREADDIRGMARYVVANPLRAGLVKQLGDYPFWNAIWLDGREIF